MRIISRRLVAMAVCSIIGTSISAFARLAIIQSHGAKATATAGNSTIDTYNRAEIIILALASETGAGIPSLAPPGHTGGLEDTEDTEDTLMPLPAGWTLSTPLVPAGGCSLQATHIYNDMHGGYTLSVMTHGTKKRCSWKRGEYHYRLQINVDGWQGGSIGKIVIE